MIRVALAFREPLVLAGAEAVLATAADCDVCAASTDLGEVMALLSRSSIDVLVLDRQFDHDIPGTIERVTTEFPAVRLLVYVHHTAEDCLLRSLAERSAYQLSDVDVEQLDCCLVSLRAGARGCLSRGSSPDQLLVAIRSIMAGELAAAPWLSARLSSPQRGAGPARLSARQMEVVRLVARGLSNKAIAQQLGLREQTVKNHLARASRVLGRTNRLELALFAIRQQMLYDIRKRHGIPETP